MKWLRSIGGAYLNAETVIEFSVKRSIELEVLEILRTEKPSNVVFGKNPTDMCVVAARVPNGMYYLYAHGYNKDDAKSKEIAADYCQEYLDALIKNLSR